VVCVCVLSDSNLIPWTNYRKQLKEAAVGSTETAFPHDPFDASEGGPSQIRGN